MPNEFQIKITGDASGLVEASKKAESALGGIEKATEGSAERSKELKKVLGELGREFPILGTLGRAAMNPIIAVAGLATMAFTHAKKALDDWNAAMDEAQKRAASADFAQGMAARADAARDAASGTAAFGTELRNALETEDDFAKKTQTAIDKLHEFRNAQTEVSSAAEAADMAAIDAAQKTGSLSEVEAISARGKVRERYREERLLAQKKAEEEEIRLREEELRQAEADLPRQAQQAEQAKQLRDTLKGRLAQAEKDLVEGRKKLTEYNEEVAKALDKQAKAENAMAAANRAEGPYGDMMRQSAARGLGAAQEEASRVVAQRDAQAGLNVRNQRTILDIQGAWLPSAENDAAARRSAALGTAARISSIEHDLPIHREALGIRQEGRRAVAGFQAEADAYGRMATLGSLRTSQAGREDAILRRIASEMKQGGISGETIQALQEVVAIQKQAADAIQRVRQEVAQVGQQMRNLR